MAVTVDSVTTISNAYTSSDRTFSHTCSGSDRILVVQIYQQSGFQDGISGMTYGGQALTRLGTLEAGSSGSQRVYTYYLLAPATGTNNLIISFSTTIFTKGAILSFNGANAIQNYTADDYYLSSGINVPSTSGNLVIDAKNDNTSSATPGTGQTQDFVSGEFQGSHKTATGNPTNMVWSTNTSIDIQSGCELVAGSQSTAYSLAVLVSTFSLTGINSILRRGWTILLYLSEFTLTGININFLKVLNLIATKSEFILNGFDAVLLKGKIMIVSISELTLTGIDVNLLRPIRNLIATSTEYTLNGINLTFNRGWKLITNLTDYTLTGIDVVLKRFYNFITQLTEYTLTGINANFYRVIILFTAKNDYVLNFIDVYLTRPIRNMAVSVKSFTISLFDILTRGRGDWTWTSRTKPSTTYTKRSKPNTTWTPRT